MQCPLFPSLALKGKGHCCLPPYPFSVGKAGGISEDRERDGGGGGVFALAGGENNY